MSTSATASLLIEGNLQVGVTAGLVIRLIALLLVFASQKIVYNIRDRMADFVVPLK